MQNRCIGVFGLSVYTTQQKIRDIFSRFGPIERIQVVIDAQVSRLIIQEITVKLPYKYYAYIYKKYFLLNDVKNG